MSFRFLENSTFADTAFESEGKTPVNLFKSAAMALTSSMIGDVKKLDLRVVKKIDLSAANAERLLYNFLKELIRFKEAEQLLFGSYDIEIEQGDDAWNLKAVLKGDKIDPGCRELLADVKDVSLHHFRVEETLKGWRAQAILDV